MWNLIGPAGTFVIIVVILIVSGIKILKEYERAVIFRLGRMVTPRGPGITYVHSPRRENGPHRSPDALPWTYPRRMSLAETTYR